MFKAYVLVRNLESHAARLDFGEFTIERVGVRSKKFREDFSSYDVNQDDWVFEKFYSRLPPGPPGSPVGGIPNDIEDVLLLLRLRKVGDISFIKQVVVTPDDRTLVQFPYWAMNDLNSYSPLLFEIEPKECEQWRDFAAAIRGSQSWNSDWFAAARRFFLSGGAKQFNPKWDDADRILDYTATLEAVLVAEKDFIRRRLSQRAAKLIAPNDASEAENIVKLMRKIYDIRSAIAHGSRLDEKDVEWSIKNSGEIELRARQALVAAVQKLPPGDADRRAFLTKLYDPTDEDRGKAALDEFEKIKTQSVRKTIAAKIAEVAEN